MATTCIPPKMVSKLKEKLQRKEISTTDITKMLPEEKTALKSVLEDFVAEKMGVQAKPEEIASIQERAKKIDATQQKLGTDLGNPEKVQENVDFFKAKKAMDDYLFSLSPSSKVKVATGTIGRGMMLASVKSPVLNIGSNTEVGITEALSRRLASGQIRGANNGLAVDYVRMANKVYQETGYDISRMTSLADTGAGGTRVLGGDAVHTQGKGVVRKIGRGVEDVVFKQLMGAPDVAFSSAHFADSVNLQSMKMAKGDSAKGTSIMRDAMKIAPETPEGEAVRAQGILDAQVATWTNKSWASSLSEGIRKLVNNMSGNLRLGDYLFPFVKTPANVIATGVDYAGLGIPKAMVKTYQAVRTGELGSREYMQGVSRDLVRSGLGITGAFMISRLLDESDFVGAYDPARAQIEKLRNSNYNAVRIGDKWISMDWFGPLSIPLTAMMYAKKYGKGPGAKTFQYGKGVGLAVLDLPGVADVFETVRSQAYKKNLSLEEMTGEAQDYITSELYSRLVPSILSDIAKATDVYERKTNKGFERIKAKVPGLRQTLPVKTTVLGEEVKGEPAWSDILFGSRVKTDRETDVIKEIDRVSQAAGKPINFTDWDKSSNKTLGQFKEKVGNETFNEAKVKYGQELRKELEKTLTKPKYQRLSDDEKLTVISGLDTDAQDKVFKQYGFKYKKAKSKKVDL